MARLPPRSFASRNSLPPEGAAAPAARQSRFRGPCWNGAATSYSLSLRERAGVRAPRFPEFALELPTLTLTLSRQREREQGSARLRNVPDLLPLPPGEGGGFKLRLHKRLRACGQLEEGRAQPDQRSARQGSPLPLLPITSSTAASVPSTP